MAQGNRKSKIIQWNKTAGGIYYPEELEMFEKKCVQRERLRQHLVAGGFREHVQLTEGALGIYKIPVDDAGNPIREKAECLLLDENLIVNTGREALRRLNAHTAEGATAAGAFDLGFLAVGDGSASGATVPQPGDTTLANEITDPVGGPVVSGVPRPLLNVSAPPPGPPFTTNLWSAQIGTTQFNGQTINEAGLICLNDATLFAYRTFTNQTKDAGFVMEFRWSIIF